MAFLPIFIHVSLCLRRAGEEIPRNAYKPPLPPIAGRSLFSHRSSLENALYQVSFPLDFFCQVRKKNHSIGFESHESEQEPTPEDKCSDLYCTQITENNNK